MLLKEGQERDVVERGTRKGCCWKRDKKGMLLKEGQERDVVESYKVQMLNERTKGDVKRSNCLHVDFFYAMHNRKISVYF